MEVQSERLLTASRDGLFPNLLVLYSQVAEDLSLLTVPLSLPAEHSTDSA